MLDISKTFAQLKADFANNVTRDIIEQNLRDFVESVFSYGCISRLHSAGPGTPQIIGTTFVKIDQFSFDGPSSSSIAPDFANNEIVIVKGGVFEVIASFSINGDPNVIWRGSLFKNNLDADRVGIDVSIGGGSALERTTSTDLIEFVDGDVIDYRVLADAAAKSFRLHSGSLVIKRQG